MEVNDVVKATIMRVTDYGFHMEAEGEKILVLIPEISWDRIRHPGEYGNEGDILDVLIIYDPGDGRPYSGSIKQLYPERNPWRNIQSYQVGQVFEGTVLSNTDYGSFVSFDVGACGLIHMDRGGGHLQPGSSIQVAILEIYFEPQRIEFEIVDSNA